jgi:hypothetical protein
MGASGMAALCTSIDSAAARADAGAVAPLLSQLVDEHQAVLSILLAPRSPAAP